MGHMVGKDIYHKLGRKIDGLLTRAPWNKTFYGILKELYTAEEADLAVRMPYGPSKLDQIQKVTGYEKSRLLKLLEGMSSRGLVLDVWMRGEYYYVLSPLVVGIFEFTMMRTRGKLNTKEWARLFNEYLSGDDSFYRANFSNKERTSPLRALPHEGTVDASEYVEVLDYEKATAIVEKATKFALGICSCRHEKMHAGEKKCEAPLDNCSSFDSAADYLIRHGMGREVSREEMLESLERSRELGLVFNADNVKKNVSFICNCCGCCCNVLLGISRFGYANTVVTSNFIAECDEETCSECGTCAEACPIDVIEMSVEGTPNVDRSVCIGCGVCVLQCETGALSLAPRKQKVLHPEDTFERVILQCLERGTLQNQMFSNPQSVTQTFMRGLVGGFLKLPPVKRALMSDALRSSFLSTMRGRS